MLCLFTSPYLPHTAFHSLPLHRDALSNHTMGRLETEQTTHHQLHTMTDRAPTAFPRSLLRCYSHSENDQRTSRVEGIIGHDHTDKLVVKDAAVAVEIHLVDETLKHRGRKHVAQVCEHRQ